MAESSRNGKLTRKEVGEKISKAYQGKQYGEAFESNVRGVLKSIHNDQISDLSKGYWKGWSDDIPVGKHVTVQLSGEREADSPIGSKGDRECEMMLGPVNEKGQYKDTKRILCPARENINPQGEWPKPRH
jgi:hypothetical protein